MAMTIRRFGTRQRSHETAGVQPAAWTILGACLIALLLLPGLSLQAQDQPPTTEATASDDGAGTPPADDDTPLPAEQDPAANSDESSTDETPADESASAAESPASPLQSLIDSVSPDRLREIFSGDDPQTVAELAAMQAHIQKIVRQVSPSVVNIEVGPSQGSGVMVTSDGFILTAGHVIMRPEIDAKIRFRDGASHPARTLGINRDIDSGLMRMSQEENWSYAEMGDSATLKPGQWVLTIAHPGGFQPDRGLVVRLGRVQSVASTGIRTDCALVGGDSGGPLFDMDGRVVGINSRIGDQIVKNIHVPVNTFAETWDRLEKAEAWGNMRNLARSSWLGLTLEAESDVVIIAAIVPGGPADLAGLEVGDHIIEFNGAKITNRGSLGSAISRVPAYELVTLVIRRGDRQIALELETGER